ncbi:hypothetical protein CH330_01855 [candidate division WOR-3 bacterium JGI_Cruoil_03_51_56]|uniref:Thioredoxin domain-containing protein n=1 Tax=candidate division WOR-3 bacterium JGI_Cruoil_03_51_56 TaxID=1973747 RepID=A0A235BUR3_UNCW3|nr:MAG: hypothetical protein CH330_06020 [candidate division WOR-3 bacterium JGI_Cruoil_03_51_56]OYD16805.1 MAG: hypothetical protein CH330_01855 [candidate division WOR-3 bacterium JGI_Cruoil_03_51_56]
MTKSKVFIAVVCALVLSPGLVLAYPPQPGDSAPDFTLPDTAYVNHSLSDYLGKVVLLNFWQSTCPYCRAELPHLQDLYDDYGDRGFIPIAVNLWEDMAMVKYYAAQYTYLYLRDEGAVWNMYNLNNHIPLNYVIDTLGIVVGSMTGFNESTIRSWIENSLPPVSVSENGIQRAMVGQTITVEPNPTSGPVTIRLNLLSPGNVTVRVYSSSGRLVKDLLSTRLSTGMMRLRWNLTDNNGSPVAPGLYFCKLVNGNTAALLKVSVLR